MHPPPRGAAEETGVPPTATTDAAVGLALYGSITYAAVVAALGAQQIPPRAGPAISAVAATASVLYVAHVFASLAPQAARAGRLRAHDLARGLAHDSALLVSAAVPAGPFVLALTDRIAITTAYAASVRLTMAMLFIVTVALGRRDGLGWARSTVSGVAIVATTVLITWLETHVH